MGIREASINTHLYYVRVLLYNTRTVFKEVN